MMGWILAVALVVLAVANLWLIGACCTLVEAIEEVLRDAKTARTGIYASDY